MGGEPCLVREIGGGGCDSSWWRERKEDKMAWSEGGLYEIVVVRVRGYRLMIMVAMVAMTAAAAVAVLMINKSKWWERIRKELCWFCVGKKRRGEGERWLRKTAT